MFEREAFRINNNNNTRRRVYFQPYPKRRCRKTRETKCLAAIIYLVVTVKGGKEGGEGTGNRKEAACPH